MSKPQGIVEDTLEGVQKENQQAAGVQPGAAAGGEETVVAGDAGAAADLAGELAEQREKLRQAEDRILRMAAEFENQKKRLQREKEIALKFAEEDILRELLPTIDNLERAIEQGKSTNDASALLEGVEMTLSGLLACLDKFGLKPIDGKGEPFDPNFHEALAMEASDEVPANIILQEYQKGYMYKDRLLRAAKVVVSKGSAGN